MNQEEAIASAIARFWPKVDKTDPCGCWTWTGATASRSGYGSFSFFGKTERAHVVAYKLTHGVDSIPSGMEIRHTCPGGGRSDCVNPSHLELADHATNMADIKLYGRHPSRGGNPVRQKLIEKESQSIENKCTICRIHFMAQGFRNTCSSQCRSFLADSEDKQWLFDKVIKNDAGCWLWQGSTSTRGQAVSYRNGERQVPVAKLARQMFGLPVTEGCRLSRTCQNINCVRPEHWLDDWERFESRMMPLIDGCVAWTGAWDEDGYGIGSLNGKQGRVTRLLWEKLHGQIPDLMLLCHTCDQPCCTEPSHLFLGTIKDNAMDMVRKGRQSKWKPKPEMVKRGEKSPVSVLNEELVREIRELQKLGHSDTQIATKLDRPRTTVYNVTSRRTWDHMQ
mgnify:FL=1